MFSPSGEPIVVSIITPAYNEADNLLLLYERLQQVCGPLDVAWEWVIVDDRSSDDTFNIAASLADRDEHVRPIVAEFVHDLFKQGRWYCVANHLKSFADRASLPLKGSGESLKGSASRRWTTCVNTWA